MTFLIRNISKNLYLWVFVAIILFGVVLYYVPLQSVTFYYDDVKSIGQNEIIRKIDIPSIFNAFNTRFLVGLSLAVNYQFSGQHPAGYRFVNLLIHCINSFLVFLFIRSTLNLYFIKRIKPSFKLEWPAFFGAMLFLCHPIQTEPVNLITQRFVLLGSFFCLVTLLLYIRYRCNAQRIYLFLSMLTAIAAMLCKEFVVVLPVMLSLYEFYFLNSIQEKSWRRCRRLLPFFAIILIVPILLSRTPSEASIVANIADSSLIEVNGEKKVVIDITRAHGGVSRQQYFLTEVNVMCTYVRLLFIPVNQNLDYDYPLFSKCDLKTIICGVFLLSLLISAVFTYKSYPLISFGVLWFFIALSVESSIIPIAHVIAEYRPYLASVGFVLIIVNLIYIRMSEVRILNLIALGVLIIFSFFTFQRNQVWKDELTLWRDVVLKSPGKERPHNNLGLSYDFRGNYKEALAEYAKAIALMPMDPEPYYNRAIVYGKLKDFSQAVVDYYKVIQLNPRYADAYCNLATIFDLTGHPQEAIMGYTRAIFINPYRAVYYLNRGNVLNKQGRLEEALTDYNKVLELDPNYAAAYDNQTVTYYQLKQYDKAWKILQKLEKLPVAYDLQRISLLKKFLNEAKNKE